MLIRQCEEQDIATIAAIYRAAVLHGTASFETEPPDEDEMMRRRTTLIEGAYPYVVAEEGSQLLGYAYAGAYRTRAAYRSTVENSVYVAPDMQGHGIGRALLTALVDRATQAGFRQMIAVIGDSANTASIRLHQAVGFAMVGTLRSVGWKHERWLDTVLMQRSLGESDETPRRLPSPT